MAFVSRAGALSNHSHSAGGPPRRRGRKGGGGLCCREQSTWSQQRLEERVGEGYLNEGEEEKEREREGG